MKLFKKDKPINIYCESLKNPMLDGEPLKPFPDEYEHEQLRVDAEIQRAYLRKEASKGESGDFAAIDSLIVGQCKDLRMLKKCYMWSRHMYEAGVACPDIIKVLSACFTQPRLFLLR